jgi:hypothetical protein
MKNKVKGLVNTITRFETKLDKLNVGFILSTGRTGTNFFESFLNQNFNSLVCKHEPNPDLFRFGIEYHRNGMSEKELVQNLRYYRKPLINELTKEKVDTYIESNPFLSFVAPVLIDAFHSPKVLHIVRHPDSYILSAVNKDPDNSGRFFMTNEDHRNRLNSDDFAADEYFQKWESMNQFERVCWNWRFVNNYVDDKLNGQDNYLRIKFEDIFIDKRVESIEKIMKFFKIEKLCKSNVDKLWNEFDVKVNNTFEKKVDTFDELKAENRDFYNKVLDQELLNKFGY